MRFGGYARMTIVTRNVTYKNLVNHVSELNHSTSLLNTIVLIKVYFDKKEYTCESPINMYQYKYKNAGILLVKC